MRSIELYKDIVAFASLLCKMGCDEGLKSQVVFVEVLNEFGFTTPSGKPFTKMNFRNMVNRIPAHIRFSEIEKYDLERYVR